LSARAVSVIKLDRVHGKCLRELNLKTFAPVVLLWRGEAFASKYMKANHDFHLIKPEGLSWRPSRL
jgi:hypothetical protein